MKWINASESECRVWLVGRVQDRTDLLQKFSITGFGRKTATKKVQKVVILLSVVTVLSDNPAIDVIHGSRYKFWS